MIGFRLLFAGLSKIDFDFIRFSISVEPVISIFCLGLTDF